MLMIPFILRREIGRSIGRLGGAGLKNASDKFIAGNKRSEKMIELKSEEIYKLLF